MDLHAVQPKSEMENYFANRLVTGIICKLLKMDLHAVQPKSELESYFANRLVTDIWYRL